MKYVVFSFDDGRRDFFTRALPILKRYHFPATLNVVCNLVKEKTDEDGIYVSWDNIFECIENGIEIANHSANHNNNVEDIIHGAEVLRARLGIDDKIGFASPNSDVCLKNFEIYKPLLKSDLVSYIRSGNQLKRDGYFYAFLYLMYKYTSSALIYDWYNRRNIIEINQAPSTFFPSVTCNRDNTAYQVIHLIKKMPQDTAVILMFHSIYEKDEEGYKKDKWSNTVDDFEAICRFLSECSDVTVITHQKLCKLLDNKNV